MQEIVVLNCRFSASQLRKTVDQLVFDALNDHFFEPTKHTFQSKEAVLIKDNLVFLQHTLADLVCSLSAMPSALCVSTCWNEGSVCCARSARLHPTQI